MTNLVQQRNAQIMKQVRIRTFFGVFKGKSLGPFSNSNTPGINKKWVKKIKINGEEKKVFIKETNSGEGITRYWHGDDTKYMREIFRKIQIELRKTNNKERKFILKTPKIYGKLNNKQLVMEYIEKADLPKKEVLLARMQLMHEIDKLSGKISNAGQLFEQAGHFMPAGKKNGKIIFYFVYDLL